MKTCSKVTVRDLPTERKCMRLFHQIVYGTQSCPFCAQKLLYRLSYAWCPQCRAKIRVKSGTWLVGSKLSFQQLWLLILAWDTKQSPGAVKTLTGVSYTTARRWYSKFRARLPKDNSVLGGVAEVDESFFGRQKFGNQTLVAGLRLRGGPVRLAVINNRGYYELKNFVEPRLAKGSLLLSDAHSGYGGLELLYARETCNHSKGQFAKTAGIENIWSRCKRQLRRQYGAFYPFHLKGLLREWEARHNFPELFTSPEAYLKGCLVPR